MNNKTETEIYNYLYRELDPAFARRARLIAENLEIKGKEKVLEVGCGRGFYEQFLPTIYPQISITGIDMKEEYLNIARASCQKKNVTFLQGDATKLSFPNASFDRIVSSEVIEHIPEDGRALSEMYRVLKKGGVAMITVPNKHYPFFWDPLNWILEHIFHMHIPSHIWWLAGIWADHVRLYDEQELTDKIKRSGFTIERFWRTTHYCVPLSHFLLYGIGKNLVERGLLPEMNRFRLNKPPGLFHQIVHDFIYSQDGKNKDAEEDGVSSMNLIIKMRK